MKDPVKLDIAEARELIRRMRAYETRSTPDYHETVECPECGTMHEVRITSMDLEDIVALTCGHYEANLLERIVDDYEFFVREAES